MLFYAILRAPNRAQNRATVAEHDKITIYIYMNTHVLYILEVSEMMFLETAPEFNMVRHGSTFFFSRYYVQCFDRRLMSIRRLPEDAQQWIWHAKLLDLHKTVEPCGSCQV